METQELNIKSNITFGKYSIVVGILLILVGVTGAVLPQLMALEAVTFIAFFMLFAGGVWATHTFKYAKKSVKDWLKPLLLIGLGAYLLLHPIIGIASLGLLLSFYLMLDAFASFMFAQLRHPLKGWGWMVFNGLTSIVLATLFLIGWPASSIWLVGLYIAINLFFNGLAMAMIGWEIKKSMV